MWRVRTGSRLHFGLLSLTDAGDRWPDRLGQSTIPARQFGGAGLMIESPSILVRAEEADEWSAEGPLRDRALAFARQVIEALECDNPDRKYPPRRLIVERAAPEHVGLGTGTQLGLAVARVVTISYGFQFTSIELARLVGRGMRSALGLHGFDQGGFLVDGGKRDSAVAPLLARVPFPDEWRVLLIQPVGITGLHGATEIQAFAHLAGRNNVEETDRLCRLLLLGLLPALWEHDLDVFGEALFDFNARSGSLFAAEQGGVYAGPWIADMVDLLRRQGVRGVGQSSWGPTVFAMVGDEEHAAHLARWLTDRLGNSANVTVTRGLNQQAWTP
jgi:beta-ribofuranosylaminobenzene 5'-phosphate synthase